MNGTQHSQGKTDTARRKEHAAIWSVAASVVVTLGKGAAGLATGSLALISDAAHSLLDVLATSFTWFAVRAADKPADEQHPFGHGKVEAVAALAQTAFLFVLSGAVAYEGVRRLLAGTYEVKFSWAAVGVVVAAIAIDAWRWFALTKVSRETGSEALAADALHFSADLVNSVLILCVFAAAAMGYPQADALVAVLVALFIAAAGVGLARRTLDTLLDAAPKGSADLIRNRVEDIPGVVSVDGVRVRVSGGRLMGEAAIGVSRTLPLEQVAALKDTVSAAIAKEFPEADIVVTTRPIQMDDETVAERVMLIAAHRRLPAHHITVQTLGERLSVSADIEIDGRMPLVEAHAVASAFEQAIRAEFGPATEVETHIEPLEVGHLDGREAEATIVARIATALAEQARAAGDAIGHIHNVRVRETTAGLVVHYHCWADPALDVASAHMAVDVVERAVRAQTAGIMRIVGHCEPRQEPATIAAMPALPPPAPPA